MLLFNIQQQERIQTFLPSLMWFTRQKCKPTSVKESISECYTGTYSCSHATYSWNCYGQFSETQCHWCLSIRQNMPHFTLPTIRYLKASPDTAIIGRDMLVNIPFIADWKKIGEHRQPTDRNTDRENKSRIDYDNNVVKKYSYGTMVSSSKQSPGIWESLG
jgi:hypothetical protein